MQVFKNGTKLNIRKAGLKLKRQKGFSQVLTCKAPHAITLLGKGFLISLFAIVSLKKLYADYYPGWGVLAINTDKSYYIKGDTAKISIAVLDDKGNMVCDADLKITITNPSGQNIVLSTQNGDIKVSSSCTHKYYTTDPDYYTEYNITNKGIYQINFAAKTTRGTYSIKDKLIVLENVDFDIKRGGATRIYPKNYYEFSFFIGPNKDHKGYIEEILPHNFKFVSSSLYKVERVSSNSETHLVQGTNLIPIEATPEIIEQDGIKIIRWPVEWMAAAEYKIIYKINIPDTSPDFYSIGPAKIKDVDENVIFEESRQWQLAIDAVAQVQSPRTGTSKSGSVSATYGAAATANNLLVAICATDNASTITGPSGWSTAINQNAAPSQAIFYTIATGGETSASCSFGSKSMEGIHIYEYTDIDTSSTLDTTGSAAGSGTTISSGTANTTYADDLLIVGMVSSGQGSFSSWSNSFSEQVDFQNAEKPTGSRNSYAGADRIVLSTNNYSTTATGPSGSWRGQIAAFQATPATEPLYQQNDFEWFVDQASVSLNNVWPLGGGEDLAENEVLTQLPASHETLKNGDRIRIQMNITVSSAALNAGDQAFLFEYTAGEDCTTATGWNPVGDKNSSTIWRLYDNTGIGDSTVQVNQISTSTLGTEGLYSEINPTAVNPNAAGISDNVEWDWPLENNNAAENTSYCFRMAKADGTPFISYNADSYPKIVTAPNTGDLMRHGMFFQNNMKKGFFWAD